MRHQETKVVFGLWNALKRDTKVPARNAIEPRSFSRHLSQICLLEKHGPDALIRLGGTDVCELFGRELRNSQFGALWAKGGRLSIQAALARVLTLGQPIVVDALGETADGRQIGIEVLLLPLSDSQGQVSQVMTYIQPLDPVARLVGQPLTGLRFLGMNEAKATDIGDNDKTGGQRASIEFKAAARPQLRLVVSNAMAAGVKSLMRAARPEAALGLVT